MFKLVTSLNRPDLQPFLVFIVLCPRNARNLVPRAFSAFKMAGLAYNLKNRGVLCHVINDEMAFSDVLFNDWQPCLFFFFWQTEPVFQTERTQFMFYAKML